MIDMLAPGRKDEPNLGFRGDGFRGMVEKETAQLFSEKCASGLSSVEDVSALCCQPVTKSAGLRRFSAPFAAFQRDEDTGWFLCGRTHRLFIFEHVFLKRILSQVAGNSKVGPIQGSFSFVCITH